MIIELNVGEVIIFELGFIIGLGLTGILLKMWQLFVQPNKR